MDSMNAQMQVQYKARTEYECNMQMQLGQHTAQHTAQLQLQNWDSQLTR